MSIVETFLGVSAFKGMVQTIAASGIVPDLLLLVGIAAVIVVPLSHRATAPPRLWRARGNRAEITAS